MAIKVLAVASGIAFIVCTMILVWLNNEARKYRDLPADPLAGDHLWDLKYLDPREYSSKQFYRLLVAVHLVQAGSLFSLLWAVGRLI